LHHEGGDVEDDEGGDVEDDAHVEVPKNKDEQHGT